MTTDNFYHVSGFKRDDPIRVSVIVAAADRHAAFEAAALIAGPEYQLRHVSSLTHAVPDAVTDRLITNAELFAAVPALNPQPSPRRVRR